MHRIVDNPRVPAALTWDLFCRVVDNYGDIGVCWRLAADLAARGRMVRLWVDDLSALHWMAPGAAQGRWPGVSVRAWQQSTDTALLAALPRADVLVEGFGCTIEPTFLAWHFDQEVVDAAAPRWIDLEYLSAESYVERSHRLAAPIQLGPARGQLRHFFFPGFTQGSGGLLREADLLERQSRFARWPWLRGLGIQDCGGDLVSMFCYEPAQLPALLARLREGEHHTQLLVTTGRAAAAVRQWLGDAAAGRSIVDAGRLRMVFLPPLSQADFDHLLWSCDLNFVRGEDSLVRAIWAGRPFVWQIYPQDDDAHHVKLDAVLSALQAPASWREFHAAWNGLASALPAWRLDTWSSAADAARARLLAQSDLTTRLLEFAEAPDGPLPGPESR